MSRNDHLDLEKMPPHHKQLLGQVLDRNDRWEQLAKLMQFSDFDIANMKIEADRMRKSPSYFIISRWSSRYDHNVTELFKLLSVMQHFQAMDVIKDLVDPAYHIWYTPVHTPAASSNEIKLNNFSSRIFEVKREKPKDKKEEFKDNMKALLNIPEIPVDQLKDATDNWSVKKILGKGGFGIVYVGEWISTQVAIKKLEYRESRSGSSKKHLMQSLNELRHLNRVRHDNILPIYGYSVQEDGTCYVVYQLMTGGSLEDRLKKPSSFKPLTWKERWNIAKGTARGLQYCHLYDTQKPLIHVDIKPANILLDSCCEPKIGDFGLSHEAQHRGEYVELSKAFGTRPYLPHEFVDSHLLSTKVDVFSFGVVLFELATGYRAHDKDRKHKFLYDHMARIDESNENVNDIIDPTTPNDAACFNLCRLMVYLGKQCTKANPNSRPEMVSVYKALEGFLPIVNVAAQPINL